MSQADSRELLRGREPEIYAPDEVEVIELAAAEPAIEVADRIRTMPEFAASLAVRRGVRTSRAAERLGPMSASAVRRGHNAFLGAYRRALADQTPEAA